MNRFVKAALSSLLVAAVMQPAFAGTDEDNGQEIILQQMVADAIAENQQAISDDILVDVQQNLWLHGLAMIEQAPIDASKLVAQSQDTMDGE